MNHEDWLFQQKQLAAKQAYELLAEPDLVLWDTETVGLASGSPAVQMAAINRKGKILFDALIDPQIPIPNEATKIHNIHDIDVVGCPSFTEILPQLRKALHLKTWCVFNLDFDYRRILIPLQNRFASRDYIEPRTRYHEGQADAHCLMEIYASFHGSWSHHHSSFTWKSLHDACEYQNINIPIPTHNALGDCMRSLALLEHLATWHNEQRGVIKWNRNRKSSIKNSTSTSPNSTSLRMP